MFKPGSSSEIVFGSDGGVDYTANGTSSTPSFTNRNNNYNVTQFYSGAMHPGDGENYFWPAHRITARRNSIARVSTRRMK
ncbi:MAG: hypothetical protein H6629_05055 [Calditrichae bacterium]|nr:hypothetical protein [Calditrichia bacterium]